MPVIEEKATITTIVEEKHIAPPMSNKVIETIYDDELMGILPESYIKKSKTKKK